MRCPFIDLHLSSSIPLWWLMALTVDPQSDGFKYFCKICKKGFLCGRALGGHMRAHGIGDEAGSVEDNDEAARDWEEKRGPSMLPPEIRGSPDGGNKRMYALRTNPNRLRNCRVCENCGKEFSSWKSFLEHRRCGDMEDAESILSSPSSECDIIDAMAMRPTKRKRTCRTKVSEEEDLATCLMMLSNSAVEPLMADASQKEEFSASASKVHEERRHPFGFFISKAKAVASNTNGRGLFECKACKKVFTSHQALGGHRASHKKIKGCFAARLEPDHCYVEDQDVLRNDEVLCPPTLETQSFEHKRKGKLHECSICHRVFSSGQALGGHKRCHWITSSSTDAGRFLAAPVQEQVNLDLSLPTANQESILSLKVSTEFFLQPWGTVDVHRKHDNDPDEGHRRNIEKKAEPPKMNINVEDEVEIKVKMAKLSELEDMISVTGGSSSPWLKVGIGPGDG